MTQKRKLNLKELELELPAIDSKETRIILGGNDYDGGPDVNPDDPAWHDGQPWEYDPASHFIKVDGNGGGNNNDDQGDLDHFYDQDNDNGYNDYDNAGDGDTGTIDPNNYDFHIENFPPVHQQQGNDCWLESGDYLYRYFEDNYTQQDLQYFREHLVDSWSQIAGTDPQNVQGLPPEFIDDFVSQNFEGTKIPNNADTIHAMFEALDHNQPILAYVDAPWDGGVNAWDHMVIIIGWDMDDNGNFHFICADSGSGQFEMYEVGSINLDNIYAITGIK